jgi:hypothetical protein
LKDETLRCSQTARSKENSDEAEILLKVALNTINPIK